MSEEVWKILRAPFDESEIGKLPRAYGPKEQRRKGKCGECGQTHDLPAVHLDYIGHAAVTDRLLQADPSWNWEPLAWDERGLPLVMEQPDGSLAFWIRLTVAGLTRYGVGTCEKDVTDPFKQLIGDALRNAAMRFGVALDLWSKQERKEKQESNRPASPAQVRRVRELAEMKGEALDDLLGRAGFEHVEDLPSERASKLIAYLEGLKAAAAAYGDAAGERMVNVETGEILSAPVGVSPEDAAVPQHQASTTAGDAPTEAERVDELWDDPDLMPIMDEQREAIIKLVHDTESELIDVLATHADGVALAAVNRKQACGMIAHLNNRLAKQKREAKEKQKAGA